jgi:hypothetical protein
MQFRPVEPEQRPRHGLSLMLPAILGVVALLALLIIWQLTQKRGTTAPTEVNVKPAPVVQVTPATQAAPAPLAPAPEVPALAPQPKPVPEAVSSTPPVTNTVVALATNAAPTAVAVQESEVTNAPVVIAPPPPKPTPLRLQAIVFSPTRPSAMVSGRTLFIGDKLGEFRVKGIDKDSLTLVSAGQTNVLTLSE